MLLGIIHFPWQAQQPLRSCTAGPPARVGSSTTQVCSKFTAKGLKISNGLKAVRSGLIMARKQRVPESQLLAKVILRSITFAKTDVFMQLELAKAGRQAYKLASPRTKQWIVLWKGTAPSSTL